ncbi:MAG: MBL fold metallo-hydrolase [Desulfobacteraceae bacterium]|nr:MBL fold metallo-hydrolase [Desulfobacteraceae bacterium]
MTLKRLSENIVYLPPDHRTDRPLLAAVSGTRKTLLIDAGSSPAHVALFLGELKRHGIPQGDYLVITHWHWDHSFGISTLNLPTIAHVKTCEQLAKMTSYSWTDKAIDGRVLEGLEIPFCAEMIKKEYFNRDEIKITLPDIIFEKKLVIDLGGIHCKIEHVGGNHAVDSSIIYIKEEKTLFLGDCLGPAIYSKKWFYQSDILQALLEKIKHYNVETYIESHGEPEPKEKFFQEIKTLKIIASSMENYEGDQDKLITNLTRKLRRQLNQDDLETITYFINGLQ